MYDVEISHTTLSEITDRIIPKVKEWQSRPLKSVDTVFHLDSSEQEIIEIATNGAAIYAFAFLLNGFNILSASFFTAITDAKRSIIISSLRGIVFMSIAVTSIPLVFGIEYIWFSVPIAELLTFSISLTLICKLSKRWERDDLYIKSIDLKH